MNLVKIKNFAPNYTETIKDIDIINFDVYSEETNEKIGTVKDILVDQIEGKLQYLVINISFWIFGKQILLPIALSRIVSFTDKRVCANGLTKEQAEDLPEFNEYQTLDEKYEQQIRDVYHLSLSNTLVSPAPLAPFDPVRLHTSATFLNAHSKSDT